MIYEALGRFATYLATLGVYGVLGLRWLLGRSRGGSGSGGGEVRTLWALGAGLSAALLAATLLRLLGQSLQAFGPGEGLAFQNLRLVAFESRWGGRWIWQPTAALTLLLGFLSMAFWRRLGGWLVLVGALALAVALPMTGHAFGNPLRWPVQSVHVLAVSLWMGTLLLATAVPSRLFGGGMMAGVAGRSESLRGFAPLAATCALGAVASALVLALSYVPAWTALVGSAWGRVLLAKTILAVAILALGARNYRSLRVRDPSPSLPRTVAVELGLGLATLVASSILTSLPHPGH